MMFPKEPYGYSNEDWCRIVRVFQRLLAPSEVTALARALVDALAREFDLGAVQVWLRAGELNMAGLALTHLVEELELVAHRQDPSRTPTPLMIGIRDSLSGFVATEGVPYRWCSRYTPPTEWEDTQWAERAGYTVGLAVPLTVHGRAIGTLTLWEVDKASPFPEGLALLVAEHASLAITQIRRLHGMRRQVQWLTGLQEVTGLLASRLSLDELYRLIFQQVARILSVGGFSINLYDAEFRRIERVLIVDTLDDQYRFRPNEPWKPVEGTIWERVVNSREPILINRSVSPSATASRDAMEGQLEGDDKTPAPRKPPPASLMFAPMMIGNQIIGVMSVQSSTPSAYDQETLDFLSTVANQAALAIENARLLERLNRQIQETQKANRLKSQFIANISHEVRTPLNSIIGFTRIVKRRAAGVLPELQVKNLDYVLESADHLLRLINDLLDLSRLEAGRMNLQGEPVDMTRLIAHTVEELEPLLDQSGNQVFIDIEPDLGLVRTDPTRVRQILVNLLSNAIKFTQGSPIRVSAGRPRALVPEAEGWHVLAPGGKLHSPPTPPPRAGAAAAPEPPSPPPETFFFIEVADQGPGMDPAMVSEMFEEFRQASAGDSRLHPGTGLGLAIVRRLVDLMKGSVWVRTSPGAGSAFRVILGELNPLRQPTPLSLPLSPSETGQEETTPHPVR